MQIKSEKFQEGQRTNCESEWWVDGLTIYDTEYIDMKVISLPH